MEEQRMTTTNVASSNQAWARDQTAFKSHNLVIPSIKSSQHETWKDQPMPPLIKHELLSNHVYTLPVRNHLSTFDDQPLDLTCSRKRKQVGSDDSDLPLDLSMKKSRVMRPDLLPINFAKLQEFDSAGATQEGTSAFQSATATPPSGNFDNPILVDDCTDAITTTWKLPASKLIQFAHLHNSAITQLTPHHLPTNYSQFTSSEQQNLFGFLQHSDKSKTEPTTPLVIQTSSSDKLYSSVDNSPQNQIFLPSNVIQPKRVDGKHLKFHEIGSNLRKLLKKDESLDQARGSNLIGFDQSKQQQSKIIGNNQFLRNPQIIVPQNFVKSTKTSHVAPFSEMKGFYPTNHRSSTLSFAAGIENETSTMRNPCKVLSHRGSKKIPVANVQPFMKPGLLDANEPIVIDPSPPPSIIDSPQIEPNISQVATMLTSERGCCSLVPQQFSNQDSTTSDNNHLTTSTNPCDPCVPSSSSLLTISENPSIHAPTLLVKVSQKENKTKKNEIQSKKKASSASAIQYIDDDAITQDDDDDNDDDDDGILDVSKQKLNYLNRKSLTHDSDKILPHTFTSPSSSSPTSSSLSSLPSLSSSLQSLSTPPPPSSSSPPDDYLKISNKRKNQKRKSEESETSFNGHTSTHSIAIATNSTNECSNQSQPPIYTNNDDVIEAVVQSEPSCSNRFRGTDRRGRGGKRKNPKKENEVAISRSGQPPFYGFFTSPMRSTSRGRCRSNHTTTNPSRSNYLPEVTSSLTLEGSGNSVATEKNLAETRLHQATRLECEELVWYFLSVESIHGNVQDNNGTTPLHISSSSGHINIAKMLLSHGAHPNAKALDGSRPLLNAVQSNHVTLARTLIQYGADPNLTNFEGRNAIQLSRSRKMRNFLRGFLNDVNGSDETLWGFNGFLHNDCESFLSNLPEDDDVTDGKVQFHVHSSAPLSVHHVQQGTRQLSCHLLTDVCKSLGTTQKFCSKKLNIIESSKFTAESSKVTTTDSSKQTNESPTNAIKYVAIDNQLRKLLKVESLHVERFRRGGDDDDDAKDSEDRKRSKKKQNVVEGLSKLAKICKNTCSSLVEAKQINRMTSADGGKQATNFEPNLTSDPLPVLDRHETAREGSTAERKNKSEDMEMPELTLYS